MLLNLKELDTLVVLTKEQKDDIIKQFGDYNNIRLFLMLYLLKRI